MKQNSSRRLVCVFVFLLLCSVLLGGLGARGANGADTEPYGQIFNRTYSSSVDGVPLPCSIYLPPSGCPQPMPVWVDLHALNGPGGVRYDFAEWARVNGWLVVSPWGRNFRGLWADGMDTPGEPEPSLYDQFSGGLTDWRPYGGTWSVRDSEMCQDEPGATWKQCVRTGSQGKDYSVSVDLQQTSSSGDSSAMGVMIRRQATGDSYWVDIAQVFEAKLIRVFRLQYGAWTTLASDSLGDSFDMASRHNLKVMVFGDTIQVRLDGTVRELDVNLTYHLDQSERPERIDKTFERGEAGVCSYGGTHRFDNFRVQNEFLFGEKDLVDTVNQVLEDFSHDPKYSVDMNRIYLSGFSVGGTGAWNTALHYPDLFAAVHPGVGETDMAQEYKWLDTYRPDQVFNPSGQPPRHYSEQDYNFNESLKEVYGGAPGSSTAGDSRLRENSARWILENALNMPIRIEHPKYDTITPNCKDPVYVWWLGMDGLYKVTETAKAEYAHSQYVWDKLHSVSNLTRCRDETAKFGMNGEDPADPAIIWDDARYDYYYQGGGHGCCYVDWLWPEYVVRFFQRATTNYGAEHANPTEVAYKTYDAVHNRAWWLKVDIPQPDANQPGLARVQRDTAANVVRVHAKNVRTTILDLDRMGMSTSAGQRLTLNVDNAMVESEPLSDTLGSTDLKLIDGWDTSATFAVLVNGAPASFTVTPTALTVTGVRTNPASVVTIDVSAVQPNMLANPGFESGLSGWISTLSGGGQGAFELGQQPAYVRTGSRSLRIRDASPAGSPYSASCQSTGADVSPGQVYKAGAHVKTRELRGMTRVYSGGGYSTADSQNARARIGLVWLDRNDNVLSQSVSPCIRDTNDWTPLEVSGTAPTGAYHAKVFCIVESPDGNGTTGSAWFDDVSLTRGYRVSGSIPALTGVSPADGTGLVDLTVTGTGFQAGASLFLHRSGQADITATNLSVSSTKITGRVDVTSAAAGPWEVEVRNTNNERGSLPGGFTVGTPLSLTSITPSTATTGAFVNATLAGTGFKAGATVRLERSGSTPIVASGVTVTSGTAATCTFSLAGAATGTWDLVFVNPDGQTATSTGAFTVNPASSSCGASAASGLFMLGLTLGFLALADRVRGRIAGSRRLVGHRQ